ncbi:MAG: hypothetical protein C0607_10380 [Azoarcus sp.]|nr:MAG: hypothetical protein C0607_10380 [Azoarcus sp.]
MCRLVLSLLFAATILQAVHSRADFFLIVQSSNPVHALTLKEAVDLFMGRSRAFPNWDFALVFDLPRDDPKRAAFYRALTSWEPAQVNSYWSRLMFSGQSMPPQPLPNEEAVIDIVKRNPSALGWVTREPAHKDVRTVLILKGPS